MWHTLGMELWPWTRFQLYLWLFQTCCLTGHLTFNLPIFSSGKWLLTAKHNFSVVQSLHNSIRQILLTGEEIHIQRASEFHSLIRAQRPEPGLSTWKVQVHSCYTTWWLIGTHKILVPSRSEFRNVMTQFLFSPSYSLLVMWKIF